MPLYSQTFMGDKIVLLMQEPTWVGDATFDGRPCQD